MRDFMCRLLLVLIAIILTPFYVIALVLAGLWSFWEEVIDDIRWS